MLDGIRILDFTRVLSGPFCTALLADVGAEVIKVESPTGDEYRHLAPTVEGESAYFLMVNRGKKSVVLDLKTDEGRREAARLAAVSDVVVENFRPGVADRLGIGYEALRARNARLVYASISGFGQTGALASRPAYDLIVQGMSGLMEVTGAEDGPPTAVGESVADLAAGLYAAWGIVTALLHRERTGEGQHVDIAMFDTLFSLGISSLAQYLYAGTMPRRVGNRHPVSAPFGAFACRDGHVIVAALNDAVFARLATAMGRAELATDPRFDGDGARGANEPSLTAFIEAWTGTRTVDEVIAVLAGHGVPVGPIWNLGQALDSGQVESRGLLTEIAHPTAGQIRVPRQPVQFSAWHAPVPAAPPGLGEHTHEFVGVSGANEEEFDEDG